MTAAAAVAVPLVMTDDQNVPFAPQRDDPTPAGDTPEHSDAEPGHRPRTHHVGNALGGEGEGSSPGGAPRRHAATPPRA